MPGAAVAASPAAGFTRADLTTFCRPGEPGLQVTGQRPGPGRAVPECRVPGPGQWCRRCEGLVRDTVIRQPAANLPAGAPPRWRSRSVVTGVPGFRTCGARAPPSRPGRGRSCRVAGFGGRWRRSWPGTSPRARIADGLSVAWNTASDAVLAEGKRALIDDTTRFDGVTAIGAGEHVWRPARRGGKYVTVIIGRTGIRGGTGPARLPDMVQGRSRQAFKTWLSQRPTDWRDGIEVASSSSVRSELPAARRPPHPLFRRRQRWCPLSWGSVSRLPRSARHHRDTSRSWHSAARAATARACNPAFEDLCRAACRTSGSPLAHQAHPAPARPGPRRSELHRRLDSRPAGRPGVCSVGMARSHEPGCHGVLFRWARCAGC
jgi:hypothetical protein